MKQLHAILFTASINITIFSTECDPTNPCYYMCVNMRQLTCLLYTYMTQPTKNTAPCKLFLLLWSISITSGVPADTHNVSTVMSHKVTSVYQRLKCAPINESGFIKPQSLDVKKSYIRLFGLLK
jgi:hypothetical protein